MRVLLAVLVLGWAHRSTADSVDVASNPSIAVTIVESRDNDREIAAARALAASGTSSVTITSIEDSQEGIHAPQPREARQLGDIFELEDDFDSSAPTPTADSAPEENSELTDQERLQILQQLERLNSTEPEQLPQPEMFISHVRNYWRKQEEAQQRIRNEILDMIVPRKKNRPQLRGPPPQGIRGPPPPLPPRPNQRVDRPPPPPGRRNIRPRQPDQVIGHQLPPPGLFGGQPPAEHRDDVQSALASKPAPAPFLFKVPGEGVIQLPPPPTHATDISSNVFPPPFPVGKPPNSRPGPRPGHRPKGNGHGVRGNRRRVPPANQEPPPRRSPPNQDHRRHSQSNHEPPRRPPEGHRPPVGRRPQGDHPRPDIERRRHQEEERRRYQEEERRRFEEEERRRFEEEDRRRRQEEFRPPFSRPPPFTEEPSRPRPELTRTEPGPGPAPRRPPSFDFGPSDGGFKPSDIDFGGSSFRPFSPVNNDLGTVPRRECDFYAEDICLASSVYPGDAIRASISRDRPMVDAMFAEVREQSADVLVEGVSSKQEELYDYTHYFGAESRTQTERRGIESHSHRDFAQDGGYLCPSEVKYARPKRAKNSKGEWKFIVNMDRYTQTLRMEKCMRPGGTCSYVSHHYKSQCSQVSNYHRLLSWDKQRGLHMDIFKVPVACSCHIQGYAYVYPPLGGASLGGRSQSTIRERVQKPPGDSGQTRPPFRTVIRPSRQPSLPPPTPPPTTTTTTTTTAATTTTTQPPTTTRRYRGIGRLRPTRRRKVTFPPYRPRPKLDTADTGGSPSQTPGLAAAPDDTFYGGNFGDRIPTETNEIRRRIDQVDSSGSGTYQVPAVLPPPPPTRSQPPEQRVNYGYHPIIDFFGK